MANPQNLIPQSERTKSEQREVARKGGIASGRSRLRKKHGKELLRALLEMQETDDRIIDEMRAFGLIEKDMTNEAVMHVRQIARAKRKADTAAYKAVMQAAGLVGSDEGTGSATVNIVVSSKDEADKIRSIGELG